MIKKLICWIWGHKTVHKVVTGHTMEVTQPMTGMLNTVPLFKYERTPFCPRCGETIHDDKQTPRQPGCTKGKEV